MLTSGAHSYQVCRRSAASEGAPKARWEPQQFGQPAYCEVVHKVARSGPPTLRDRHRLRQIGSSAYISGHRSDPPGEPWVAHPQAIGHHQIRQIRKYGIAPDSSQGKTRVESSPPGRSDTRGIVPFEAHKLLK